MKKIIKIIALIMSISPSVVYGQPLIIHSPTAANLGLYGEIPVSYYTGTPNISIPLYEIKGKQVTVPVGLSYHPAGIRPDIHPGPVGLGWSLQAGGVISRTVRGNSPDESNRDSRAGIVEGYLSYAGGWIAQINWKDYFKNSMNNDCQVCRNVAHGMASTSDLEPDEFSFSVLNISGKFYFDHTGQIQVQCDNPVKVIFNNEFIQVSNSGIELDYSLSGNMIRAFKSFTIIDECGTQYHFGGAGAMEFSDPISYGRSGNGDGIPATGELLQATSWFLTQIQSADGADVINFEYERGPFVSQLYRSFDYYSYSGAGASGWTYNNNERNGTLMSPVYLKRIVRENGENITLSYTESNDIKYSRSDYEALFANAGTNDYKLLGMTGAIPRFQFDRPSNKFDRIQWLKLDGISVKNTVNESVKQISFVYNNNSSERLFLNSINIYGNNSQSSPINYAFTYKNKDRLPAKYLTCITDHWGFNNGKTYSSAGFNSQNKATDSYYTDSGVLSEIRYPTGGATQFEYELHDYSKVVNTKDRSVISSLSGTASGLRIKKITTDNLVREFFYKETPTSSVSSGVLNMLPQYNYSIVGRDCDNYSFNKTVTHSVPVIPLTKDNEGLYIGYTYVCERLSGGSEGYTQYHYTNHDNGYSDVLLSNGTWHRDIFPSDPHCSRYFERGRLKKETSLNAGGQSVAVNETVWQRYGSQGEDNPRAFLFESIMIGYDYCSSAAYLHYCYKFLPCQKLTTVRDLNGQNPVTTQTTYDYDSYGQIRRTEFTASDNSVRKQEMKYPADFTTDPYPAMVTKHILNPVVETSIFRDLTLIEKTAGDYALQHNSFYAPVNAKYQKGNGDMEIRATYLYDTKGNIREEVKNGANSTVYLWGYNNQYPIAKIENAGYSQVQDILTSALVSRVASADAPAAADLTVIKNLRTNADLSKAMVIVYEYKPLVGILKMTDPRGIVTDYVYDSFGRLEQVLVDGKKEMEYKYHYKE